MSHLLLPDLRPPVHVDYHHNIMSRTYLPPPMSNRHPITHTDHPAGQAHPHRTAQTPDMALPPIRPLGQRYDGSPMPSLRNVAQATGYPLPVHPTAVAASLAQEADKGKERASDDVPPKKKARRHTASGVPTTLPAHSSSHQLTSVPPSALTAPPAPPTTVAPSQTIAPPKRGRKPTHTSRAARDSARKVNHSRIEKRRRERINDALAALRIIVPREDELARMENGEIGPIRVAAFREDGSLRAEEAEGEAEDGDGEETGGGKKKKQPKEFKLEVLDRTVAYVRFLVDRVRAQDGAGGGGVRVAPSASMSGPAGPGPTTMGLKRKRAPADEDDNDSVSSLSGSEDNVEGNDTDDEEEGEEEEMDDADLSIAEHHRRRSSSPHPAGPRSPSPYPLLPTPTIHPYRPPPSAVRSSAGTTTTTTTTTTTQHNNNAQHHTTKSHPHTQMHIDVRKDSLLPSPPSSVQQSATISPGGLDAGVPLLALPEPGMALPLPHQQQIISRSDSWQHRRHTTISPSVIATSASEAEAAAAVLLQLKRDPSVSPTITAVGASPRFIAGGGGRVAMTPMSVLGMGMEGGAGAARGGW